MIIYTGWNMVSSNGYSDPIGQFFGEYSDNITVMWKYVPGSGYSLVTKNDNFEQGVGYWLKSNLQFNYDITGLIVTSPLEITWAAGWNMISTPFNEPIILANMSWESNIVVIWTYVPGSGYVLVQKTDALEPGRGYWFKFDTTVTETFIATTEPEQEPEPEPEPEPYPLDVIIKVEFTESLSFVKGQYIQDASGIGVLDKDGNGNLIMGTPAPTDPPTPAIIISAKSGNEINKNMTGFLFNFNKDTTKITNGVSSNSPSSGQDPYCLEYYNVQNVSNQQILFKPIFNYSITNNLNGAGAISGFSTSSFINLTSEFQELMVIPSDYFMSLEKIELTSPPPSGENAPPQAPGNPSRMYNVVIEYEGPILE